MGNACGCKEDNRAQDEIQIPSLKDKDKDKSFIKQKSSVPNKEEGQEKNKYKERENSKKISEESQRRMMRKTHGTIYIDSRQMTMILKISLTHSLKKHLRKKQNSTKYS